MCSFSVDVVEEKIKKKILQMLKLQNAVVITRSKINLLCTFKEKAPGKIYA